MTMTEFKAYFATGLPYFNWEIHEDSTWVTSYHPYTGKQFGLQYENSEAATMNEDGLRRELTDAMYHYLAEGGFGTYIEPVWTLPGDAYDNET